MNKELKLYQLSHHSFALAFRNMHPAQSGILIQLIKKHGGKWNVMLCQFECPLQNLSSIIKEIKSYDEKLTIKDIPLVNFKNLLNTNEDEKRKYLQMSTKHKWNRILLLDPLLVKRYDFFFKFLTPPTSKKQTREKYKRILLICWQSVIKNWTQTLQRAKVLYKQADYQSFMPEQSYKIACTPLLQNEVDILTYERLNDYIISKKVLDKYTSIICDDCQAWFNNQTALYTSHDIGAGIRKILTQFYSAEKDLILITAKLMLQKPAELLEICSIIKPKQFGIDVFRIARNECNDATWMKKRYMKENKFLRQLYYLLHSTILINLAPTKATPLSLQHRVTYSSQLHSLQRMKAVDNRFKNINQKTVLNNFQSQRLKNTFLLSETSKLQQARYIKQRREVMILDKLPALTKYLFHVVKELGQRTVLVLQSQSTLQKVQKFLIEQQVPYLTYEISWEQLKKGSSYLKYNTCQSIKLCILVRDKLLQEYRKCKLQYQKELQQLMQMQAERELGITTGGLYELALHHKNKLTNALFKKQQMLDLPKINSARNLAFLDTYWYDFSEEKENIINNILNAKQLTYVQANNQESTQTNGETQNCSHIQDYRRIDMVKNYFISKGSVQRGILERYNLNLQAYQQEQQQTQNQDSSLNLQQFIQHQLQQQSKQCEGRRVVTNLYDIDEQYDRLEFAVYKQRENQKNQPQIPLYNNHIQGLVPQTPCLKEVQKKCTSFQPQDSILQQIQTLPNQVQWLNKQSEQESVSSSQCSLDLRKYLANERINQQQSQKYLQNLSKIKQAKMSQKLQQYSDSYEQSIHLEIKQQEEQSNETVQKEWKSKQQKLIINEPTDIIEIDDQQDDIYPLPIVSRLSITPNYYKTQMITKPQQRHPSIPGLKLWGAKNSGGNKKIARKYMSIRIQLTPNLSSLKGSR